jgi:hypothetical protein
LQRASSAELDSNDDGVGVHLGYASKMELSEASK